MTKSRYYLWLRDWFFILAAIVLIWLCFAGCREAREIRRDNKAFTRVVSSDTLALRTSKALDKRFPCLNVRTEIRHLPGREIVVEIPKLIIDTIQYKKTRDSLLKVLGAAFDTSLIRCNELSLQSYKTGYDQAVFECNNRKVKSQAPDTVFITEKDTRELDRMEAEKDVNYGMYLQADKQAESSAKLAKKRLYWLIGICAGIGLLLFVWLWSKFKKSPLKK